MGCPGDIEGCAAETCRCPCGVPACEVHGHAAAGDDPYCPHWLRAEIPDATGGRGYKVLDVPQPKYANSRGLCQSGTVDSTPYWPRQNCDAVWGMMGACRI
jgi:hypothetical protein